MPPPLPTYLAPYLTDIRARDPMRQTIAFCPIDWATPTLAPYWTELAKAAPHLTAGTISREDVKNVGLMAKGGAASWDAFFLAVMIWGFGMTGYGRYRTKLMFATPDFSKKYSAIREWISAGKILDAYKGATNKGGAKIGKCGPPFFTKLFYFLGLVFGTKPMPLILDSRVCASLSRFTRHSVYFKPNPTLDYPSGYVEYCNDMTAWSAANSFAPDQLEIFLFCPPVGF